MTINLTLYGAGIGLVMTGWILPPCMNGQCVICNSQRKNLS